MMGATISGRLAGRCFLQQEAQGAASSVADNAAFGCCHRRVQVCGGCLACARHYGDLFSSRGWSSANVFMKCFNIWRLIFFWKRGSEGGKEER